MPVQTSHDEVRRSVSRDLAESSHSGAPPLGHLAGLHRGPTTDGTYALALDPDRPLMAGGAGILEFAMLADLALGGAIRNQVGRTLAMPTIAMTLQLTPGRTKEVAQADGQCTARLDRTATARSQLRTVAGDIVGDAQGVFALPRQPYHGPGRAMPWDIPPGDTHDENPSSSDVDLSSWAPGATEEMLVDRITAHAAGSPAHAWGTAHVEEQMTVGHDPVLTPTAPMANRLGHIQGGALFTTAVLAAARADEFSVDSLVTGTIEFIEAASLGDLVVPEVSVLRVSSRSLFASILLVHGGRTRCHGTTVFRR